MSQIQCYWYEIRTITDIITSSVGFWLGSVKANDQMVLVKPASEPSDPFVTFGPVYLKICQALLRISNRVFWNYSYKKGTFPVTYNQKFGEHTIKSNTQSTILISFLAKHLIRHLTHWTHVYPMMHYTGTSGQQTKTTLINNTSPRFCWTYWVCNTYSNLISVNTYSFKNDSTHHQDTDFKFKPGQTVT